MIAELAAKLIATNFVGIRATTDLPKLAEPYSRLFVGGVVSGFDGSASLGKVFAGVASVRHRGGVNLVF